MPGAQPIHTSRKKRKKQKKSKKSEKTKRLQKNQKLKKLKGKLKLIRLQPITCHCSANGCSGCIKGRLTVVK